MTKLGQGGMAPLGQRRDRAATARFSFDGGGPDMHLIQATYQGVAYNLIVHAGCAHQRLQDRRL